MKNDKAPCAPAGLSQGGVLNFPAHQECYLHLNLFRTQSLTFAFEFHRHFHVNFQIVRVRRKTEEDPGPVYICPFAKFFDRRQVNRSVAFSQCETNVRKG